MPTRNEVTAFQDSLNVVSQAAQDEVQQVFKSLDWDTPDTALRQLRAAVQEIVPRYADATVSLSAQWVEDQLGLPAELPKAMHKRYIGRRLNWSTAKAFEGDIVQALETTLQVIDHLVSGPGKKTVSESCRRHGVRWARVPRGATTCRFCLMLASRGYVYESAEKAGRVDQFHASCVVPGTRVSGPEANVAMMREFEGEIVTLTTAGGHELSITPNHPVLTRSGWKPAGLLEEGDDLVCGPRVDRGRCSRPNEDHVPPRIEDVMRAAAVMVCSGGAAVPGSSEQFHGDGVVDSKVNIVNVNDLFRHEVHAALVEPMSELDFEGASLEGSACGLLCDGSCCCKFAGGAPRGSSCGGVGCSSLGGAFCGCHFGGSDLAGFRSGAHVESGFSDPSVDDGSAKAGGLGERPDALSIAIPLDDVRVGGDSPLRLVPVGIKFDPGVLYGDPDGVRAYAELGRDLVARLSGFVEFDRLIGLSRSHYSGHVYNLSTVEGWYNANSITVSNCDCVVIPEDGIRPAGYDPDALYKEWQRLEAEDAATDADNSAV